MARIALIGDHDPRIIAHQAIPLALELAARRTGVPVESTWIGTDKIGLPAQSLDGYPGIWCTPGSPYKNMNGALAAIRHAREQNLPFLGTCGGFQHALIEFARNAAGIAAADHAETAAGEAPDLVVTLLACSLVEKTGAVTFTAGSRLDAIFGGAGTSEGYHCNYGVNSEFRERLEAAGLRFTGSDAAGDIRACELPSHRFFVGTLFQPERSALRGKSHPLVEAFIHASASAA